MNLYVHFYYCACRDNEDNSRPAADHESSPELFNGSGGNFINNLDACSRNNHVFILMLMMLLIHQPTRSPTMKTAITTLTWFITLLESHHVRFSSPVDCRATCVLML